MVCRRALALLVLLPLTRGASAIETRRFTLGEIVRSSSAIVVGTVVAKDLAPDLATNHVWTEYVVAVEQTWKGEALPERRLRFFGADARLEIAATYLLFLDETPRLVVPVVGVGQGIFRVGDNELVSAEGEVLALTATNQITLAGGRRVENARRERDPDADLSSGESAAAAHAAAVQASRPAALFEVRRWLVEPAAARQ